MNDRLLLCIACCFGVFWTGGGALWGQTDRAPAAAKPASDRASGQDLIDRLTDAERAKLRRAIQEVWSSPEVSAKREALHAATQEFRKSLTSAIDAQDDPELKRVMTRLLAERYLAETGAARTNLRSGAQRPEGVSARKDVPATDRSGAAEALSPAEQEILRLARERALKLPAVVQAIRRREGAVSHEAKMEAAREFRVVMRKAMLEADPQIAAVFAKLERVQRDTPTRAASKDRLPRGRD